MSDESKTLYQLAVRMDKVENHLDDMRAAMIKMAKTEERVSIVLEQTTELFKKYSSLSDKLNNMEVINATQGQSIGFFERLGWVVFTAFVGLIAFFAKGIH